MKVLLLNILLLSTALLSAQENFPVFGKDSTSIINLSEYLGYVKAFHPNSKTGQLNN